MPNKLNMLPRQPTLMTQLVKLQKENAWLREELGLARTQSDVFLRELEKSLLQNECDMLLTGEEIRSARSVIDAARKEQR